MVPSASVTRPRAVLAGVALAGILAGCSTTMQEAARLQLNSARIRTSEVSTRVTVSGRTLRVERVALISSRGGTAFVIVVRNPTRHQVSDLPISVGVRTAHGRPVYLNQQSGLEYFYFDAHLPVLPAGATLTWVYTTSRHVPRPARPFALVGSAPSPPAPASAPLPVVRASASMSRSGRPARLAITVHNLSSIPQYQLPVFAFATRGGRYVAAGSATVIHLAGEASRTLDLGVTGNPNHAQFQVEAPPAVLQ